METEAPDLDCDRCGKSIDLENRYVLTMTHGNVQEEFDFCSFDCLRQWAEQYAEEQRKAAMARLDGTLSAEQEGEEDVLQSLEEEVTEESPPYEPQPPYPTPETPEMEPYPEIPATTYPDDVPEVDQYAEALSELKQRPPPPSVERYADEQNLTPVNDLIEESDPAEKVKRDKVEKQKKEKEFLQEEFDKIHEEYGKGA